MAVPRTFKCPEQAEQEHALAESKKHAEAAHAQLSAELESARARLVAANEKLEQQQRSSTVSMDEERQATKSKEESLQVSRHLLPCQNVNVDACLLHHR